MEVQNKISKSDTVLAEHLQGTDTYKQPYSITVCASLNSKDLPDWSRLSAN